MESFLIRLAINYVLNQLAGYGESINWQDVAAKADSVAEAHFPSWMAHAVDGVVAGAVSALADAMKETADLRAVVTALMNHDWNGAIQALTALVEASLHPSAPAVLAELSGVAIQAKAA